MINMYFDTEFTGLRAKTDLISIGILIGEKLFYAEILNVDVSENTVGKDTYEFLQSDVFPGLLDGELPTSKMRERTNKGTVIVDEYNMVSKELIDFLFGYVNANPKTKICPISDVMYYDMVLLMDLINHYKPTNNEEYEKVKRVRDAVSPAGIDINDFISRYKKIDIYKAFDYNREKLLDEFDDISLVFPGKKHNALYDARVIRALYKILNSRLSNMNTSQTPSSIFPEDFY